MVNVWSSFSINKRSQNISIMSVFCLKSDIHVACDVHWLRLGYSFQLGLKAFPVGVPDLFKIQASMWCICTNDMKVATPLFERELDDSTGNLQYI